MWSRGDQHLKEKLCVQLQNWGGAVQVLCSSEDGYNPKMLDMELQESVFPCWVLVLLQCDCSLLMLILPVLVTVPLL